MSEWQVQVSFGDVVTSTHKCKNQEEARAWYRSLKKRVQKVADQANRWFVVRGSEGESLETLVFETKGLAMLEAQTPYRGIGPGPAKIMFCSSLAFFDGGNLTVTPGFEAESRPMWRLRMGTKEQLGAPENFPLRDWWWPDDLTITQEVFDKLCERYPDKVVKNEAPERRPYLGNCSGVLLFLGPEV